MKAANDFPPQADSRTVHVTLSKRHITISLSLPPPHALSVFASKIKKKLGKARGMVFFLLNEIWAIFFQLF